MPEYVLRIEGVDLGATIEDTEQLSVMRGASLALLAAPSEAAGLLAAHNPKQLFSGASQAAFLIEATDDAAADAAAAGLRNALAERCGVENRVLSEGHTAPPPLGHLHIVVDVATGADLRALDIAEARNRARQFQDAGVPLPAFAGAASGFDDWDRTRPGVWNSDKTQKVRDDKAALSPATLARFNYGRIQREAFYRDPKAASDDDFFSASFADIAAPGNAPDGCPTSLKSKMSVVYADGNKFTAIRNDLRDKHGLDGLSMFSNDLRNYQQTLLKEIVAWLRAGRQSRDGDRFAAEDEDKTLRYRFETLLWGGDELCFVMPSWLAVPFIEGFFNVTGGWEIGGHRLTHSMGVVVCPSKTAIRQARKVAKELADGLKDNKDLPKRENYLQIEVFESIAMPDTDIDAYRKALYGIDDLTDLNRWLALPGDGIGTLFGRIEALKLGDASREPFARSQLYSLLRTAANAGAFRRRGVESERKVADAIDRYFAGPGRYSGLAPNDLAILPESGASRSLSLAVLASLWDYVAPFETSIPTFGGASVR